MANDVKGHGYDGVLLGYTEPLQIDVERVQERLDSPDYSRVAQSLGDIGFHSAIDLLSTYGGQARDLKTWLNGAEINRDGNLRLQYLAGLALNTDQEDLIYRDILNYRRFPLHLFRGPIQSLQAIHAQHEWR